MSAAQPIYFSDLDECVEKIIARVGKRLVVGAPLGIGKPNQLLNALFRRARQDASIQLRIMTALSLQAPQPADELKKRLLKPFAERHYADYPALDYLSALLAGELPDNIEISEFYFNPGRLLDVTTAQQNYISSNYTHAVRDMLDNGVNVLVHMVSRDQSGSGPLSLSSNPDITLELAPLMREKHRTGEPTALVAQINRQLPFMTRDARVADHYFDFVVDDAALDFEPFAVPNMPLQTAEHMIGLYVSTLIKDAGTLQIGIGAIGDAICYALELRHQQNALYRQLLEQLELPHDWRRLSERLGGDKPFQQGLYAASEMVSNGLLQLYQNDILKRRVYHHSGIQQLLDDGLIGEEVTPATLEQLLADGIVQSRLSREDFDMLQRFGVFKADLRFHDDMIECPDGRQLGNDLNDADNYQQILEHALGSHLHGGVVMHGAFFLGPRSFYRTLRSLKKERLDAICMTSISNINQIYDDWKLARIQRRHARFANIAMMMTLSGAAVSDALEDGQVVSGVGGQYNFVAMAHALPDGRSILMLKSSRRKNGRWQSNIVWNYGHTTIPRHLRDIVVTEYGIADLRGKTDAEVIAALLNIADSRFQPQLLEQAKKAGKIAADYQIAGRFRNNFPDRLEQFRQLFEAQDLFMEFPFGSDFSKEEITLINALQQLQAQTASRTGLIRTMAGAMTIWRAPLPSEQPYLERMKLLNPANWREKILQKLVIYALAL